MHTAYHALVREEIVPRFYVGSGILRLRRIRDCQAPRETLLRTQSQQIR